MHPLAYEHLKKVLEDRKIIGPDETCEYYPCHFEGQDCTWCFCPFYPCEDEQTGGEWVEKKGGGRVWGCSACYWIHDSEVAKAIMVEFTICGIENVDDVEQRTDELKGIFSRLKEKYPPTHKK